MMNNAASLFVFFYSAVLEICRAVVVPPLLLTKSAAAWNIRDRLGTPQPAHINSGRPVVWMHAASLGESKLLLKFLDILKKKHPGQVYVLTATTRAGVEHLKAVRDDRVVAAGYFPFDTIGLMKKMVRQFAVSRLWLMETELWPSLLWVCMHERVPVGIVNARMEKKSYRPFKLARFLCEPMFRYLDIVLAQSAAYASRFERLGVRPAALHIIGNLKNAVELRRPMPSERNPLRAAMKIAANDFVLTAGCLHAGEGRILTETLDKINKLGGRVKCIVVPRYPDETPSLMKELGPKTLCLRETSAAAAWDTCLVDKFGVLEDMYRISDAAFVGGTFVAVGGHNVWDAAQFGIPVFFGPDFHTQEESCKKLLDAGVGFMAQSGDDLAALILQTAKTDRSVFAGALSRFIQGVQDRQKEIEQVLP